MLFTEEAKRLGVKLKMNGQLEQNDTVQVGSGTEKVPEQ